MKKFTIENVQVTDIADKGRAVGRSNDKAIFIEGAVPGDIADIEIYKKSRSFDEGIMSRIISPSQYRVDSFCSHFGLCGGCKWQNMSYEGQLLYKEKLVKDVMLRIAHIKNAPVFPILGCTSSTHYRNKLEFTFTNKRYLLQEEMHEEEPRQMNGMGFHIPGKFNKVLNIQTCFLQDERSNEIRNFVREFTLKHGYAYFDLKAQTGLMRNLIIRNSSLDEWMVIVVFSSDDATRRSTLMQAIKDKFPWLTSIQYIINQKRNDTIHDQTPVLFHGRPYIIEQLENLKFIVGPKSFFQTNSKQAERLYEITRQFAGLTGNEIVYDLYTGTGSIAAFVASGAQKVTGIEYVKEAIDDAIENARLNGITNMKFFAGDMKDVLTAEFFLEHGKPDVIITDPPRAGMHPGVVNCILESGAKRLVYVSCNPATQARDLLMLSDKYHVSKLQPVDMFPHTSHIENIALLELKQN